MVTANELRNEVQSVFDEGGTPIRLKYVIGSVATNEYDNYTVLTTSGTDVWTTGLKLPITTRDMTSSTQPANMEQGVLKHDDSKLYLLGNINVSGTIQIGIGSPVTSEYSVIDGGIKTWSITGDTVYHQLYIRYLTTGSLYGQ